MVEVALTRVKEANEANAPDRSTEGLTEILQEVKHFRLLLLLFFRSFLALLPLAELYDFGVSISACESRLKESSMFLEQMLPRHVAGLVKCIQSRQKMLGKDSLQLSRRNLTNETVSARSWCLK